MIRMRTLSLVLLGLLIAPVTAWAQSSITGVVRDPSGAVLPGVTVEASSPALIEQVRSIVTDAQGLYRIVDLRPGPYTVTFTLPGFTTVKRTGIELRAEFTATVDVELQLGNVAETITVSGEAPLVDTRSARAQTQYAAETLQSLPGNGRLSTLISVLPGAVLNNEGDRASGALSDRSQTRFAIHGAPNAQPVIDGMNTEMAAANTGVFVFNGVTFQEVVAETTGIGADRDTGGVQLNMIPKDGGNLFSGTANFAFTGPDLQSNNIDDKLLKRGLDASTTGLASIKKFVETAVGVGGPLKRNRLWFYGAARKSITKQYAAGIYWNKMTQPQSMLYVPDLSRPASSNDFYRDYSLRLTLQANDKNKLVVGGSFQHNCNCVYALFRPQGGSLVTPEAATEHEYEPDFNVTSTWTYTMSSKMLLTAAGGINHITQTNKRGEGVDVNSIQITEQSVDLKYGAAYGATAGGSSYSTLPRRQYHQQFAVTYVTGSHNFKSGVNLRELSTGDNKKYGSDLFMANRAILYTFNNQRPVSLQLLATPTHFEESALDAAVYAQDQWTIRRLTMNLGLRYNDVDMSSPELVSPAGFFVPERRIPAAEHIPHWRNLSPRVGGAYDLFGTGKTAIKGSIGRYPDIIRVSPANPANLFSLTTNRTWNDAFFGVGDPRSGNFIPDCDQLNSSANGECGAWSDQNFGRPRLSTRNAPDSLTGFNKQFYNWQASVSFQHELTRGLALNVGYFRTWYGGFLATNNQAIPATGYDTYCITAPKDSLLPGGGGNQICGLYDVKPAFFGRVDNLATQASNYGGQTQVYNGVDLTLNGRFGQGGQFSGGLSTGRTVTDNCYINDNPSLTSPVFLNVPALPATSTVPRNSDFCHVSPPWSSSTQLKFLAVYPLPYDIETSAIVQNSPGIPITASYVITNAQVQSVLGRSLAACPAVGACTQTVRTELIPPNTMFEPRLTQVDLRVSRSFRMMGSARLRGSLDIYNIFNANSVLSMTPTYGASWRNAAQVLSPRLLRIGAQLDF
ncbi:MAG TPA: carboxypeptidase regulatory-like domain-containing protein [Vicinamibacterales bacterium]|nr:carboxypeptidase regulatory-like domain-containing protein [Vicinamibacterales bacterium]